MNYRDAVIGRCRNDDGNARDHRLLLPTREQSQQWLHWFGSLAAGTPIHHWDGSKEQVGEFIFNQPWSLMPQGLPPTWPFAIGPHSAPGSSMTPRAGSRGSCSRPTAGLAWPSTVDHIPFGLSVDPAQSDVLVATTNALRLRRFVHRLGRARSSGRRSRIIV